MNEERTFKTILQEALNLHTKTVKECQEQVEQWKTKFEILSKQKHKYQDEYRNIKKESDSVFQENNKLKGEIDSLRQLRDQRPEKCSACSSFKQTIKTLKDVYETSIDQKNDHIAYLEDRIKYLERDQVKENIRRNQRSTAFRPDSTCKQTEQTSDCNSRAKVSYSRTEKSNSKFQSIDGFGTYDPNRKSVSSDQGQSLDRSDKGLKLRLPRNKKRSRYSEDHSPEQKRTKLDTTIEICEDGISCPTVSKNSKRHSKNIPNIIVPETCAFDDEIIEEDEKTCIPYNDAEETAIIPHAKNRNHRWNTAIESSSSENDESILNDGTSLKVQGQVIKSSSQRSWLQSMLASPDCGKVDLNENETQKVKDIKSSLMKNTSDPTELSSKLCDDPDITVMSEGQQSFKVVPLRNRKMTNRRMKVGSNSPNKSKDAERTEVLNEKGEVRTGKSIVPTPVSSGNRSGCSQKPIDIPSDNDSPLILRSSGMIDNKQRYPEVDVLFEDSDESPTSDKSLNKSNSLRNVRSRKSRSQEKSPDLNLSLKSSRLKKKGSFEDPKVTDSVLKVLVDDNQKLKQTTLSQAFINSSKQDSDLQQAIEKSLDDARNKGPIAGDEDVETKENTHPFKVPSIPKLKTGRNRTMKSPPDLDQTMPPYKGQKHSPNNEFDETVLTSKEGNSQHIVNGSLDPAIQLSQLCADSQSLGHCLEEESEFVLQNEKNRSPNFPSLTQNERSKYPSSPNQKQQTSPSLESLDFRLEDLNNHSDIPKTSTCIDEDSQSVPCSSTSVKFGSGRMKRKGRQLRIGRDTEELAEVQKLESKQPMDDSFDVLLKKADEGPGYAYLDVVRGKDNRQKLPAFWCQECADYYLEPGANEEEIWKKMQECSKHRARAPPPSTPPNFWEIGFPDTIECEERGYINRESPVEKKQPALRERPNKYRQLFKSKNDKGKYKS